MYAACKFNLILDGDDVFYHKYFSPQNHPRAEMITEFGNMMARHGHTSDTVIAAARALFDPVVGPPSCFYFFSGFPVCAYG